MPNMKKKAMAKKIEQRFETMKKARSNKGNKPSSKSGKMLDKGNRPARMPATKKPGAKPAPMPKGPKSPTRTTKMPMNPLDKAILEGRKLPSKNKRPGRYLDK